MTLFRAQVLDTPATTREVQVPAEFMTVRKMVLKSPATTRTIEVPAEYQTVMACRATKSTSAAPSRLDPSGTSATEAPE